LNRCSNGGGLWICSLDLSLILRMSFHSYALERGRALYAGWRFMSELDDDMAIIMMLTGRLCKHYGITTIHESICQHGSVGEERRGWGSLVCD
jgi:hypothetical protein